MSSSGTDISSSPASESPTPPAAGEGPLDRDVAWVDLRLAVVGLDFADEALDVTRLPKATLWSAAAAFGPAFD